MPITRDARKLRNMPGPDLINWRQRARAILSEHDDPELSALYESSTDLLCDRAAEAWSPANRTAE